ncbi:cytochrome b5-like heme/steroid binding domain-containing protein [Scenedesmus sp. NREL 46B-D3]|nr:cytochrome b5-like heme/steroid binding domain-containing protein [Scenedesmus sp. NREL 46B-D3]
MRAVAAENKYSDRAPQLHARACCRNTQHEDFVKVVKLVCQLVHSCHCQALAGAQGWFQRQSKASQEQSLHARSCFNSPLFKLKQTRAMADKTFTLDECKKHTSDKDCWLVVHGKVYNVTDFLEEHPGGYDIILTSAGKDSTQDFEEIGHSNSARELLEKYLIGKFSGGDSAPGSKNTGAAASQSGGASKAVNVLLPLLLILAAVLVNMYLKKE